MYFAFIEAFIAPKVNVAALIVPMVLFITKVQHMCIAVIGTVNDMGVGGVGLLATSSIVLS